LKQAVVVDALVSTFIAPLLIHITRAHATADYQLVVGIAIFMVSWDEASLQAFAKWPFV
jgi:hypothetical protein